MSASPQGAQLPASIDALRWLAMLWGPDWTLQEEGESGPAEHGLGFTALPSLSHVGLLVPRDAPQVAAAAVRQFNQAMSLWARLKKAGAARGARLGLADRLGAPVRFAPIPPDGPVEDPLAVFLGGVLRLPDVRYSVALGPRLRPNLKPVIQVSDQSGAVVSYVKVGWNDLTRSLVDHEVEALKGWELDPPRTFSMPRVLATERWNGLAFAFLSPVRHRLFGHGVRMRAPRLHVFLEIADRAGPGEQGGSWEAYLADLSDRVSLVPGAGQLSDTLARLDGGGESETPPVGGWHGDLGPWNMTMDRGSLFIWDWERSSSTVPRGFDVLHFYFQVGLLLRGLSVPEAATNALRAGTTYLRMLGVPAGTERRVMSHYLVERVLRILEGHASGVPVRRDLDTRILEYIQTGAVS